jgi:hypothetical protein
MAAPSGAAFVGVKSNRGEHRPLDQSAAILQHLDRRHVDASAVGPAWQRRSGLACHATHAHPGWRKLLAVPGDSASVEVGSGVAAAHVSSSGRQKKSEVLAMGWSLEGRRLVSANNEGNLTTWYVEAMARHKCVPGRRGEACW